MASTTYSGSFGGVSGADGLTTIATGTPLPYGATITNVHFSLKITADKYSTASQWVLNSLAVGGKGGTPNAYGSTVMRDTEHTFSGNMEFVASDVSKFSSEEINVFAWAWTNHSTAKSYLWDFSITVDYVMYSACIAPSSVRLSSDVSTGSSVVLSWEAGVGGNENPFIHYEVSRWQSADGGNTWDNLAGVGNTTETYLVVEPPKEFGLLYHFYVRTVGTAGADYASDWATCAESLQLVRPSLVDYTDPEIVAGQTSVKAAHMLELQNNINALRISLGLSAYGFSEIRAGYTGLADWNTHIVEMRTAIDGITASHEAWIALGVNRPRADVLMQLRRVVAAV